MKMTAKSTTWITTLILLGTLAWAHGTHETVLGTVTEISEGAITIESKEEARTFAYDGKTRFEKGGEPASAEDLKAGERVAIEVHTVNGKPTAALVRFGTPPRRTSQD